MYARTLATAALLVLTGLGGGCRNDGEAVAPAAPKITATPDRHIVAELAGLEQYCRDKADDSALLQRYGLTIADTMAEHRFDAAVDGASPASLRVQEQHGQIQGIWLDWGVRGGISRQAMATALALPLLATPPGVSDETDYKTVYLWRTPTPRTSSISLTCGGDGERDRCYKLYFECVEYYD